MAKKEQTMKTVTFLIILFSTILLGSCESQSPSIELPSDISLGSNFGFCLGPCFQEMKLKKGQKQIEFEVIYRSRGLDGEESTIFKDEINEASLALLAAEINLDEIKKLDEVYGCPDCADGGSEWIELNIGSDIKRITFEFGKAPKEIEKLVNLLRRKKEELSTKYVQAKN